MDSEFITNVIKFNGTTNGRDKICRLLQYTCRLAWGRYETKNLPELVQTLKNIENAFSMTRKLLRFGKSLDFIQGAMRSIHLKDAVLRLTLTLSKINQALYLLFDHFLWLNNVGALKLNKQYWSEISSRFYLATLVLNVIRDIYSVYVVAVDEYKSFVMKNSRSSYHNGDRNHKDVLVRTKDLPTILKENMPLVLDSVKNLFDLTIPLSTLGVLKLSPQKQGLFGIVSSFIAVLTIWNPALKLVPSWRWTKPFVLTNLYLLI